MIMSAISSSGILLPEIIRFSMIQCCNESTIAGKQDIVSLLCDTSSICTCVILLAFENKALHNIIIPLSLIVQFDNIIFAIVLKLVDKYIPKSLIISSEISQFII